ncbi:hypothetical protein D3C84_875350 [compost metagenome]
MDLIGEGLAGILLPGFDFSDSFVRFSLVAYRGVMAEATRKLCGIATIAVRKVRLHDVGELKAHFAYLLDGLPAMILLPDV